MTSESFLSDDVISRKSSRSGGGPSRKSKTSKMDRVGTKRSDMSSKNRPVSIVDIA